VIATVGLDPAERSLVGYKGRMPPILDVATEASKAGLGCESAVASLAPVAVQ
jgi:hypothetical protein